MLYPVLILAFHIFSPFLGGYGARTHGVYQHLTSNGNMYYPSSDHCLCCPQLCDNAGNVDAVLVIMPVLPMRSV